MHIKQPSYLKKWGKLNVRYSSTQGCFGKKYWADVAQKIRFHMLWITFMNNAFTMLKTCDNDIFSYPILFAAFIYS